jgi:hypothetical protein
VLFALEIEARHEIRITLFALDVRARTMSDLDQLCRAASDFEGDLGESGEVE